MSKRKLLADAVRCALLAGACTGAAFAQDAAPNTTETAKTLGTITVTGSRIKRVESETSSPVLEIDRQAIDKTGALTIGDFIQDIPTVAGTATNTSVNNGGGTGAATVSLRGLGEVRTLLLVNGRRIVTNDVNSIPMSMVERVEILKDGASSTYGSDAVGGVVNFILKSNYSGVETSVNYGISAHHDGERMGGSSTIGWNSDRGNLILGLNYNDQKEVSAADRDFSKEASTLYAGVVVHNGSSRTLTGRYVVPQAVTGLNCRRNAVTHIAGTPGTSISNFRCFDQATDAFNYQGVGNVELTPQERAGLFISGTYDITDTVSGYIDAFVNKTRSNSQIAPLPYDGRPGNDDVVISRNNIYNPFGVDIIDSRLRLAALGNRRYQFSTDVSQITAGLKGVFGDTSWSWDANVSYGKLTQDQTTSGYIISSLLTNGLGPSFVDGSGAHCGTPGAPIAGCIPLNFFGVPYDPSTPQGQAAIAALDAISANSHTHLGQIYRGFQANFAGDLFDVSAGTVKAAFGVEGRNNSLAFVPDALTKLDTTNFTCQISSEACATQTAGEVKTWEVYGEVLYPLTSTFNLTLGTRFSHYNSFGSTTNSKLGFEWRPGDEWLVRGTYAQVFRAPTISDLFGGLAAFSAGFTDPCNGLTGTPGTNPACQFVPTDGSFHQSDTQLSAFLGGTPTLKPEQGSVETLGIVYEPSWISNFSATVDFWRVHLDDTIGNYGTFAVLTQCFQSTVANPSPFCASFSRDTNAGEIIRLFDPKANVGKTDTQGIDFGFKYSVETDVGKFRASLDTTYLDKYDVTLVFGGVTVGQQRNAGTYLGAANGGLGNYSQWRSLGSLAWNLGNWDAQWTARYVSGFRIGSESDTGVPCADVALPPGSVGCEIHFGAQTYHNVQLGYDFQPWHMQFRVGIDNAFDKQPPIMYQNNTLDGNTDPQTFDTVGRFYWASLTAQFGRSEPVREVEAVVAPTKTCADLDDDSDGVNNCNDKCPNSSGAVGSDGCAVPAPEPEPVMEAKPFKN